MNKFIKMLSLFIVGLAILSSRRRGAVTPPAGDDEMRRARRRSLSLACCTREAFRDLPASAACRCCCLRRAQPAASAELATATIDQREVQRRLAATPVVARRFGSTQGAALLPTCPLRQPAAVSDHHARALAGAQSATRRIAAADHQLGIALQVALSVQHRRPPSLTSAFSPRARPSLTVRVLRKFMNTVSYS